MNVSTMAYESAELFYNASNAKPLALSCSKLPCAARWRSATLLGASTFSSMHTQICTLTLSAPLSDWRLT